MFEISIIIPTFRPGNYLYECLDSVIAQDFPKDKMEILIVLNGPTSPYYEEIESFILEKREVISMKLITSDPSGVSNARNMGIEVATGKYITFIDDDDMISTTYLSELYKISQMGYTPISNIKAFTNLSAQIVNYYLSDKFLRLKSKSKSNYNLIQLRSFFSIPYCKLLIKDNIEHHRFNTKFKNGEDSLFMLLISDKISKLRLTSEEAIYYRRIRSGSAVSNYSNRMDVTVNNFNLIIEYCKTYFSNPLEYNFLFTMTRILAGIRNICFKKKTQY